MTLHVGARFAQLVFVPVLMPRMTEVRKQDGSMIRGGFGSTG
jgi:dUTPase